MTEGSLGKEVQLGEIAGYIFSFWGYEFNFLGEISRCANDRVFTTEVYKDLRGNFYGGDGKVVVAVNNGWPNAERIGSAPIHLLAPLDVDWYGGGRFPATWFRYDDPTAIHAEQAAVLHGALQVAVVDAYVRLRGQTLEVIRSFIRLTERNVVISLSRQGLGLENEETAIVLRVEDPNLWVARCVQFAVDKKYVNAVLAAARRVGEMSVTSSSVPREPGCAASGRHVAVLRSGRCQLLGFHEDLARTGRARSRSRKAGTA